MRPVTAPSWSTGPCRSRSAPRSLRVIRRYPSCWCCPRPILRCSRSPRDRDNPTGRRNCDSRNCSRSARWHVRTTPMPGPVRSVRRPWKSSARGCGARRVLTWWKASRMHWRIMASPARRSPSTICGSGYGCSVINALRRTRRSMASMPWCALAASRHRKNSWPCAAQVPRPMPRSSSRHHKCARD